MNLDVDAAAEALERFGGRLGLSAVEAAAGIHRIINANMANEIRLVSVKRGYDPRQFVLVPLGGAGPVHSGRLAAELGIPTVVVPPVPGVLSALGLLVANVEHDATETVAVVAEQAIAEELEAVFARLDERVAEMMRADRVPMGAAVTSRLADMRYIGQGYTLEVSVPLTLSDDSVREVTDAFHEAHAHIYGHSHPDAETEFVNLRVVQAWALPRPRLEESRNAVPGSGHAGSRPAYFEELGAFVETPVYDRNELEQHQEIVGPAIVEQADSTLVLYPDQRAVVDEQNALVVSVPARVPDAVEAGAAAT
jgi:N-methylhydantoinase A